MNSKRSTLVWNTYDSLVDGNFLDAIDRYTEAINMDPDFVDAYKRRGRIFYYKGWSEKARHDLETAVRLDASDKIIEVHPYFDEVNVGRMNLLLGEIMIVEGTNVSRINACGGQENFNIGTTSGRKNLN